VVKNYTALFLLALAIAGGAYGQSPLTASASPNAVTFTYQLGNSTMPAAQSVSLRASAGTPAYTVVTADPWVTATPTTGDLPVTLSVQVNPNGLPADTYTSIVNVKVAGIALPVQISVTLVVTLASGGLTLIPDTVSLTMPPTPQTATVQAFAANVPVSFTASSGNAWLTVSPTIGIVLPGAPATFTLTVDSSTLAPQSTVYDGKVTIVSSGTGAATKSQVLTVAVIVQPSPPTITGIWPPSIPVGSGNTMLTITGTNFYKATTVSVTGVTAAIKPTVLDSAHLDVTIPTNVLQAPSTLTITVTNPPPGGSVNTTESVSNAPTVGAVLNSASYDGTAISPGELVALFGINMGPMPPLTMTENANPGFVDTSLGGVSVQIDGQAAPLIYVSATQINLQVPYEVTLGAGKSLILTYGSGTFTFPVTIQASDPGLFTANGSGAGPVAAINAHTVGSTVEWSLNAVATPAHAGDVVELYLTGEGAYADPTVIPEPTGFIVPATLSPLPEDKPYPTVTIDSLPATVQYAGPVPGCIMGILQMNVLIPAVTDNGAVPLVITFGAAPKPTFPTQATATLYVHQ
jgi:uncharacterized protein (TIGR03437 family)